ncbi:hypothetical protein BGZ97_009970, partial [Linnemannia gamsii]
MPRRQFERLQDEPDDFDPDQVDHIELTQTPTINTQRSHHHASAFSPVADRAGPSPIRGEAQPRRSMHQVDMDLEWPMIDIPQELREMRGED